MPLRIMVSRHSAFYSPLIATIAGGFLKDVGIDADYSVLQPGQRSQALIRDGIVDVMQSAVSSNWKLIEAGTTPRPVHFAQINRRDGFFLAGRRADPDFQKIPPACALLHLPEEQSHPAEFRHRLPALRETIHTHPRYPQTATRASRLSFAVRFSRPAFPPPWKCPTAAWQRRMPR